MGEVGGGGSRDSHCRKQRPDHNVVVQSKYATSQETLSIDSGLLGAIQ